MSEPDYSATEETGRATGWICLKPSRVLHSDEFVGIIAKQEYLIFACTSTCSMDIWSIFSGFWKSHKTWHVCAFTGCLFVVQYLLPHMRLHGGSVHANFKGSLIFILQFWSSFQFYSRITFFLMEENYFPLISIFAPQTSIPILYRWQINCPAAMLSLKHKSNSRLQVCSLFNKYSI